jgi:hypothetical protein
MFRRLLPAFALILGLAAASHASMLVKTAGPMFSIGYHYSTGGKLDKAIITFSTSTGIFTTVTFQAASGADIKDSRSLSHALSVAEGAFKNYQPLEVIWYVSGSGHCTLGTGNTCGDDVIFSTTSSFQVQPYNP